MSPAWCRALRGANPGAHRAAHRERRRPSAVPSALLAVVLAVVLAAGCTSAPTGPPRPPAGGSSTAAGSAAGTAGPGASAAPTAATPPRLTVVASGDILLHPPLWDQARVDARTAGEDGRDFRPLLAGVRQVVSAADVAICHLETPLAPAGGPFSGYPRFSVPPEIATALADNGYDACSTASNHTIDHGEPGVRRTLDALDAAGIRHAGSYRSKAEQGVVATLSVRGVTIALLSYTFSLNGLRRPPGKEWIANVVDPPAILAEARRARARGAQIVVVSLHAGTEYQHGPNAQQRSLARTLLASPDIDLLLGHHAHVVQPFEKIGDKWVVYGMGNKVAHHAAPSDDNREGVLARVTFTPDVASSRWLATSVEAVPVWMQLAPDRLINIAEALRDPTIAPGQRSTLRAAWRRIQTYLTARGAAHAGLVVVGG